MRRTALGGVLMVMAGVNGAVASPLLAGVPPQVAHRPVITTLTANLTTVALKQSRTLIDWQTFDVAQGQQVDFLFQTSSGIVLNRINSLAVIDGKILGCVLTCGPGGRIGGNVWFDSPEGVLIGQHAEINVGGFLATTSPLISNRDFLNGSELNFKFGGGPATANVTVQSGAQITASGSVALISPSVVTGAGAKITAGGETLYGAAEDYVIEFDQTAGPDLDLVGFEVPGSALSDGTVSTTPLTLGGATTAGRVVVASVNRPTVMNAVISLGGMITATSASGAGGGDIVLSATGAPATVDVDGTLQASHGVSIQAPDGGAIHVSGTVSTLSPTGAGGTIRIGGAGGGAVDLAAGARLDASSSGAGLSGGAVTLTGSAVQVDGTIAATGPAGGGTIRIGGGAHGADASVADATTTTIGDDARIDASATASGAGGEVVVWSNQNTSFQGYIVSRGGASAGDGGAAEVSSAGHLAYAGAVDLRAANGSAGQLLLDPSELTIIPTGGTGGISGGVNSAGAASSTLGVDAIDTALLSADVTISTHMAATGGDGVIAFNGGAGPLVFNNTATSARQLTFDSQGGFLFDTSVVAKGQMNLTLDAGAAAITLPTGAYVHVTDGALTLSGSDLTLQRDLSATTIDLNASGTINQSGGVLTANVLTGSSGGSTSLTGANKLQGVETFTAGGDFTLNTVADATISGLQAAGAVTVTSTAGTLQASNVSGGSAVSLGAAEDLFLSGAVTGPSTTLTAAGTINQLSGVITANTLTATASRGISLTGANAVATLGGVSNTAFGGIAVTDESSLSLAGDVSAAAQNVSLVSNGAITQTSGVITAGVLGAAAGGGLSLNGPNIISSVSGLTSAGGDITFVDAVGFTLDGDVSSPNQTVSLASSGGAITQTAGSITASTFSASAVDGLLLSGENQIGHVTALSNSGPGGLSFNDNQSVTIDQVTLGGGDISLNASSGDLTLTSAVTSPGALTLAAAGNLTGTSLTSVGDLTVTSGDTFSGAINFSSLMVGGDAALSAVTMSTAALQPTFTGTASSLKLTFTSALAATDLSGTALSAPGSLSVAATAQSLTIGSITAGANVTLSTAGSLSQAGGVVTAASLTASAVTGLQLGGSNMVASVTSLTNTTSGGVTFADNESVTIGSVAQGGDGGVELSTSTGDLTLASGLTSASNVYISAANNLTVDGVTAASDVDLSAGGVLAETPGAGITTGGSYFATALTMNAGAEQPIFTPTSHGSLNLTFTQSGSTIDLTGVPLSAPGSVTVQANNESLTVDSISAGSGQVSLTSGGTLAAASGATINLLNTYDDSYNATAMSLNLANPAIVQPVFSAPTYGYLSLTLTQSGGTVDLTGAPLSAPQQVSVQASGANLTVDSITSGGGISLTSGGVLSAANGAAINLSGDYDVATQTANLTHPVVVQPTFAAGSTGSLNLTFTQSGGTIDLTSTPLSAPGSISVSLASSDSNENLTVGSLTAAQDVSLYTGSYVTNGGALTIGSVNAGGDVNLTTSYYYYSGGGPITSGPISAGGSVNASGGYYASSAYSFTDITAGTAVNLSTGYYYGGALTTGAISAGGPVSLSTGLYNSGALTVGAITSGADVNLSAGALSSGVMKVGSIMAGGGVTLDAGGALQAVNEDVTVQTGGSYAATGATIDPALFQPTFTGATGDLGLTFTGGAADLTGHPLSAPGGSVAVSATAGDLTVDSISALQDIKLSASGDLAAASNDGSSTVTMTLGGNYSATGSTIDPVLYQPVFTPQSTGNLNLTFNSDQAVADLTGHPLTAPGSVSIAANNAGLTVDSITAGADVTLYAAGALQSADVSAFAITLGGDYSATGATISSTLYQPTFTPTNAFGGLSLTFTGSNGADLTGSALTAPGSISVSATDGNLTIDSLAAGTGVTLYTSGTLQAAGGAVISLFGDYNATANQFDTANTTVLQPTFTSGSTGSLALTFTQSGATTDLTGFPLTAPGSVSVNAENEDLTVDSITAGGDVTLNSAGNLSNASGAVITLGGDYNATGVTISTGLLQPTFTSGSTGSLSLTFDQSGSAIDLTGTPLIAPGSLSIQLNGDNENLTTGTLTAFGGDVTISSYYYNGGTVTTGALNAGGSVNVATASYYGGALSVGAINAGDSVNLATGYYAGAALTAGPIVAGGDVTMSTGYYASGAMTVSSISAGGAVSLRSGGPLSAASTTNAGSINFYAGNGDLTVGALTAAGNVSLEAYSGNVVGAPTTGVVLGGDYSAYGTTIDTRLYQPTFTSGSNGSLSLTFTQTGGVIDLTGFPLTAPGSIDLSSSEDLTIDSLNAGSQVQLNASGALNEVGSSVITAQDLSASAANGIVLNGANNVQIVDNLYNGNTGGISFTNQGDIQLQGPVTASGQTVNLVSNTGSITEESCYYCDAVIYADTLTASAATGINLTGTDYYYLYPNQINKIGPIVNTTSGGVDIINDADLALISDISAPGQTVNIVSEVGALSQTGGAITAATFTASAANGITLNDANAVAALGALTNTSSGGVSFTNGGDLSIDDSVTAAFQTVKLVSNTGAVVEGAQGLVTAETLSGSAANGFHLDQANEVARVGDLANIGAGGVSFTNAGDVFLTGTVTAAGQTVSLVSQTGAIGQSTGAVTAGLLDLTAVTGVDLSGPNVVSQLGAATTTSGDVNFVNAGSFVLTADLDLAGQNLSLASNGGALAQSSGAIQADSLTASAATGLSLTGSNAVTNLGLLQNGPTGGIAYTSVGDLTLASNLDGFAQAVGLTSQTGVIAQAPGEAIQAGLLSVSAANGIGLRGANAITDLNTASNSGSGGIAINDADSLTTLGAIQAAGQAVSLTGAGSVNQLDGAVIARSLGVNAVNGIILTDVSASLGSVVNTTDGGIEIASVENLQLDSDVTAPGQTVEFQVQGSLGQAGGAITAATLSISANSGVQLGGANQVAALGDSFSASGGFALNNVGDLALTGNISAPGQTLSLATTGTVTQSSGQIEASTLSVSAQNGISLGGDNLVANLGAFSNPIMGGVTYVSAGDPTLTGDIFAPAQTVNLIAATGGFNQTAGVITAGTLNVSAATGIALTDANAVANLGQLVNTTSGGIAFTNGGDIDLSTNLAVAGQTVSLTSMNGAITQAPDEMIAASTLNASAANGISFRGVNAIDNLGVISNTGSGGVVFAESAGFGLTGSITAAGQNVALTSTSGAITQTEGVITAGLLNLAAVSGISLGDANLVASLGTVTNSGSGGIVYAGGASLGLTGVVTASGQSLELASTGAIDQTGGAIVAGTVGVNAGTSVGLTALTASNQVTITAGGALTLTPGAGSSVAVQAPSVVVESWTGQVDLGDGLSDPGFSGVSISNAAFSAIKADAIAVYAGYFGADRLIDPGPSAGSIKVGTLSFNTTGLDAPSDGASLDLFAGPGATVSVSGSITPNTAGYGHILIGDSVADTWTPTNILVSGGVGATGSTLTPLASVELNAVSSVILGDAAFQSAVETAINLGRTASINITTGVPTGTSSTETGAIFVGASTLTLRAQGAIVSQNTGGGQADGGVMLPNSPGANTVLTLGTTQASTLKAGPVVIDLFGGLTNASGTFLTGKDVAPSTEVVLEPPLQISDAYRFNSCTIGKTGVCVIQSLPVNLIEGNILMKDPDVLLPNYFTSAILTLMLAQPVADPTLTGSEDIADPLITGVGNEEIWRRDSCNPNGSDQACP